MKISVITLHTVSNYGSALQTYATQKIIEGMGHQAEFVNYYRPGTLLKDNVEILFKSNTMQKFKKIWGFNNFTRKLTKVLLLWYLKHKKNNIREFIKDNICLTEKEYYSFDELKNNPPVADVYVTGSDQVWNSRWNNGVDKAFFLDYAISGKPRVAFAASIGQTSFEEDEAKLTKELLEKYSHISMREQSAVDLLAEIGIKSQLILDPTLMLDREKWKDLAVMPKEKKPYLLIYQLNRNSQMEEYAERLAEKNNWEIVRLSYNVSVKGKKGKCVIKPTVERFLGYFMGASCVLTDSFHATAFSLNLGVDFISVMPSRFGTRISNILKLTKTEFRLLKDYSDFEIVNRKINKNEVEEILQTEREKGFQFLNMAINKGE